MSHVFDTTDSSQRREGLAAATNAINSGRLVVMPTDTVYGLAANAFDATAVSMLLTAKGRGRSMPSPVLVHRPEALDGIGTDIPEEVRTLTQKFWPGALTVIVHQQPSVDLDLGDAMGTVAVRMPDDETALDLLAFTGPLAVSSANRTGQPAATTTDEAQEMLQESVDVYLNDGPRGGADQLPSTIVDATGARLRIVRQGALSLEALREAVPSILAFGEEEPEPEETVAEETVIEETASEDAVTEDSEPAAHSEPAAPSEGGSYAVTDDDAAVSAVSDSDAVPDTAAVPHESADLADLPAMPGLSAAPAAEAPVAAKTADEPTAEPAHEPAAGPRRAMAEPEVKTAEDSGRE